MQGTVNSVRLRRITNHLLEEHYISLNCKKIHRFCLTCLFKKTTKKDYVWKLSSSKIFTFLKDYLCLLEKSCVASLAETSQGLYFPSTKFKNSDLIQNIHAERLFPIFLGDSLCLNFEDKFPDLSPKMKFRFKK